MPKSILKRSRKKTPGKRSKRRVRFGRKKALKRPYKRDARKRHARRHKRRSYASAVHGHHDRIFKEAEVSNYLMNQLLKTAGSTEGDPYHYQPRHHSKDPEYKFSGGPLQEFKRGHRRALLEAPGQRHAAAHGKLPSLGADVGAPARRLI